MLVGRLVFLVSAFESRCPEMREEVVLKTTAYGAIVPPLVMYALLPIKSINQAKNPVFLSKNHVASQIFAKQGVARSALKSQFRDYLLHIIPDLPADFFCVVS